MYAALLLLWSAAAADATALTESGLSLTAAAPRPTESGTVFNAKACCGAVGDGKHNDTAAIAKAFGLARKAGGGVVLLPGPGVYLSGPQHMESHTIFRIAPGATLLGSAVYTDYPFEWVPGVLAAGIDPTLPKRAPSTRHRQSLIAGARCASESPDGTDCAVWARLVNVTIEGGGTVDGNGASWWWANDAGSPAAQQRMDMVQPYLVDGLVIRDVTLRASPEWTLHPTLCHNVLVDGITIDGGQFDDAPQYAGHNVDGCDPDSCTDVVFQNSRVRAGDDCVAIYSLHGPTRNVTVRNVTCHTPLSITHGPGGTSDVLFDNCTVRGDWGGDRTHFKPRWWKTALRIKSDRNTNGTRTSTSFCTVSVQYLTHFPALHQPVHAVRRTLLSGHAVWNADWCLRSDIMTHSSGTVERVEYRNIKVRQVSALSIFSLFWLL